MKVDFFSGRIKCSYFRFRYNCEDMIRAVAREENTKLRTSVSNSISDSSDSVVRESANYFVYGYYSKFNYDPEFVAECYTPDAVIIYEGQQYNGRDEILKLLAGMKEQGPEVEIRELNAVRSFENATQVHLIGEFKSGDKKTFRRFTQSLVLVGDHVDTFQIASEITSFALQIRGFAKRRANTVLGRNFYLSFN